MLPLVEPLYHGPVFFRAAHSQKVDKGTHWIEGRPVSCNDISKNPSPESLLLLTGGHLISCSGSMDAAKGVAGRYDAARSSEYSGLEMYLGLGLLLALSRIR